MQRFELKDAKSHKFWEINVEGDTFTVRFGRMSTDGQTSTKTFPSAEKAEQEAAKLIRSKTKKGYVEVAATAAPTATKGGGNPALEAPILANPADLEAWRVYGDWLGAQGDPRGELVGIECALASGTDDEELRKRRDELIATHAETWLGKDLIRELEDDSSAVFQVEWRFGFVHFAKVAKSWDRENAPTPGQMIRLLLKSDASRFLHQLNIGITDLEGDAQFKDELNALTKTGKLHSLRRLVVGDFTYEDCEISWSSIGNVGKVWPVLPNLQYLKVHGGSISLGDISLGNIAHDKLEELVVETGGLPGSTAKELSDAKLPNLTRLEVWLGTADYGGSSSVKDLAGLLQGKGLPKLKHLGLQNADFQDEIVTALCSAPIVKQLTSLDVSMGVLSSQGAHAMVEHKDHFEHLESINVERSWIGDAAQDALREAFGDKVNIGSQSDEASDYRYVAVGE